MAFLHFSAPPLPHYVAVGEDTYQPGEKHPSRRNVGVFDLLVVTRGKLFMGEEDERWMVEPGHALILRPDKLHYGTEACEVETHFYWLHFQTTGDWTEVSDNDALVLETEVQRYLNLSDREVRPVDPVSANTVTPYGRFSFFLTKMFPIRIPRLSSLTDAPRTFENLLNIIGLEHRSESSARWRQQVLFQEVVRHLHSEPGALEDATAVQLALRAASLIRANYRGEVSHRWLREKLNFHPTYVARCMRRVLGMTQLDYLNRYRIEQAKLLLMNSDMPIQRVAEEVGIPHFSYFSKSFVRVEGVTPREYRKRYRT